MWVTNPALLTLTMEAMMKVYLVVDKFCGTHIDDAIWRVFTTERRAKEFISHQPDGIWVLEIEEREVQE